MSLLANNKVLVIGGEIDLPDAFQPQPSPSQQAIVEATARIYGGPILGRKARLTAIIFSTFPEFSLSGRMWRPTTMTSLKRMGLLSSFPLISLLKSWS